MQADAMHVDQSAPGTAYGSVTDALRAVETFLLRGGGLQTARRNAWNAVCEDRRRAQDRREAQHVLETLTRAPAAPSTASALPSALAGSDSGLSGL
jgi:hypothetical protein